jgi:FkbM family methyltransferase
VEFYGQLYKGAEVRADEWLISNYLNDIRNGYFIECGALNGTSISNCLVLEKEFDWSGINIEPNSAFNELIRRRPSALNLRVALADTDAELIDFYEDFTNLACSTSSREIASKRETQESAHLISLIQVPTITFRTLVDKVNVRAIDLFSLGVEGMEMKVIRGMEGSRVLPKMIFVEVLHQDKRGLTAMLEKLGYRFESEFYIDALYIHESIMAD